MKKVLFLMVLLLLMVLGAANIKAQVRIGGDAAPNAAAVLDLNATDVTIGTKGLALPRVSLTAANTPLQGSPTIAGMLVYNTNAALGEGVYFWNGSEWLNLSTRHADPTFPAGTLVKVLDTLFTPPVVAAWQDIAIQNARVHKFDICLMNYATTSQGQWAVFPQDGVVLASPYGGGSSGSYPSRLVCLRFMN